MSDVQIHVDQSLQACLSAESFPPEHSFSYGADLQNTAADSSSKPHVVVIVVPASREDCSMLAPARKQVPAALLIAWNPEQATEDPHFRLLAYAQGATAVTGTLEAVQQLVEVASAQQLSGTLTCPCCHMRCLTEAGYCIHQQLYHVYLEPRASVCPICRSPTSNIVRHAHDSHSADPDEDRTGVYCIVVVRRPSDGKFLLVQERQGRGYWFPGGGAHHAEPLCAAAVRETQEEAGVHVELRGLVAVTRGPSGRWSRATFYAEPKAGSSVPKTVPDWHSAGACWVGVDQLDELALRNHEPLLMLPAVADGGLKIKPLELPDNCDSWFEGHSFR